MKLLCYRLLPVILLAIMLSQNAVMGQAARTSSSQSMGSSSQSSSSTSSQGTSSTSSQSTRVPADESSSEPEIVVFFVNGINNDRKKAEGSRKDIEDRIKKEEYVNKSVVEKLYNRTKEEISMPFISLIPPSVSTVEVPLPLVISGKLDMPSAVAKIEADAWTSYSDETYDQIKLEVIDYSKSFNEKTTVVFVSHSEGNCYVDRLLKEPALGPYKPKVIAVASQIVHTWPEVYYITHKRDWVSSFFLFSALDKKLGIPVPPAKPAQPTPENIPIPVDSDLFDALRTMSPFMDPNSPDYHPGVMSRRVMFERQKLLPQATQQWEQAIQQWEQATQQWIQKRQQLLKDANVYITNNNPEVTSGIDVHGFEYYVATDEFRDALEWAGFTRKNPVLEVAKKVWQAACDHHARTWTRVEGTNHQYTARSPENFVDSTLQLIKDIDAIDASSCPKDFQSVYSEWKIGFQNYNMHMVRYYRACMTYDDDRDAAYKAAREEADRLRELLYVRLNIYSIKYGVLWVPQISHDTWNEYTKPPILIPDKYKKNSRVELGDNNETDRAYKKEFYPNDEHYGKEVRPGSGQIWNMEVESQYPEWYKQWTAVTP